MKKLKGEIARKECMVKAMQAELDKVCIVIWMLQKHAAVNSNPDETHLLTRSFFMCC